MNNPNCICITAMARHRCRYYCEGPEECDRIKEIEPIFNKKNTITMQTINDLTQKQLLKVIEKILKKIKPDGKMLEAEFDMLVITLAYEKENPNFVIREGHPI